MSLVFFPRHGHGERRSPKPRFALRDSVLITTERHARGTVIGRRAPNPSRPEVLVQRADGSERWIEERFLRTDSVPLTVVAGGRV